MKSVEDQFKALLQIKKTMEELTTLAEKLVEVNKALKPAMAVTGISWEDCFVNAPTK